VKNAVEWLWNIGGPVAVAGVAMLLIAAGIFVVAWAMDAWDRFRYWTVEDDTDVDVETLADPEEGWTIG
jgi:ABC-type transport system involved in cytochrome c biogenesis permease subunit